MIACRKRNTPLPAAFRRRNLGSWILVALFAFCLPRATAQTYSVIHNFTGCADGGYPTSTLVWDRAGNLCGTTEDGGVHYSHDVTGTASHVGSVFKATRFGNNWTCSDLYRFEIGANGQVPIGGVALDANGDLYGTASGGGAYGAGVIWEITPN